MNTIIGELGKSPKFIDLLKQIEQEVSPIAISGLTPKKEIVTYEYIAESKEIPYQRIEALNHI